MTTCQSSHGAAKTYKEEWQKCQSPHRDHMPVVAWRCEDIQRGMAKVSVLSHSDRRTPESSERVAVKASVGRRSACPKRDGNHSSTKDAKGALPQHNQRESISQPSLRPWILTHRQPTTLIDQIQQSVPVQWPNEVCSPVNAKEILAVLPIWTSSEV